MKRNLSLAVFIFIMIFSCMQISNASNDGRGNSVRTSTIDSQDTVVFDMSRATPYLTSMRIPVYIHSDDTIYSLDFSFQYDHSNLSYDSIANLSNYIEAFSYYNSVDSTVRFTSNSTNVYAHDSDLVAVQFAMLSSSLYNSDLYNLSAYLNGDPCSVKIIGGLTLSTNDHAKAEQAINIFPNPATNKLYIECKRNSSIHIYDLAGIEVQTPVSFSNGYYEFDMGNISTGNYVVKISSDDFVISKIIMKK